MSLGRPGIFNRPPVGQTDGSLWYLDSNFGWKASGSALTFDGTTLTGALAFTNLTNQQVLYGSSTGGISQSSALTFNGTSLTTTGQFISTIATGTAPLSVSSTTAVANLNASLLLDATWAAPGSIGATTPNAGAFTTLTATSTTTVGNGSGAIICNINGAAATTRDIVFQTNGSDRWKVRVDGTAESGSDAGSNFNLSARKDDGTAIDIPVAITRASGGVISLSRPLTIGGQFTLANTVAALDTAKTTPTIYGTTTTGGAYPFTQAGHLIISPRISGAARDVLIYPSSASSAIFFSSNKISFGTSTTDDGARLLQLADSKTISGTLADGYTGGIIITPTYSAATAQTVTRHSYLYLANPVLSGAGPAALTDACAFYFDAAAGTHKAVDSGTTKTSPGTVSAWVKVNINGTVYYLPAYTSKTS